ncbi:DDE-type integrase/transposase/recombinase [Bacillus thuringiensis]
MYLYLAVHSAGYTIDFYLNKTRNDKTHKAFLQEFFAVSLYF